MNFRDGRIEFHGPHREAVYFPLGPPANRMIGDQYVHVAAPIVQFSSNRYSTTDEKIARGMLNERGFNFPDGFYVDPGCMPQELLDFWPGMSTETRKKVTIALIEDATVEEAFALVPEEETLPVDDDYDQDSPNRLDCPVGGGCKFVSTGKQAAQVMFAHMMATHPDYKLDQA